MIANCVGVSEVIRGKAVLGILGLVLLASCVSFAQATTQGQLDAGAAPKHHGSHRVGGPSLDERIRNLIRVLDLDAKQQAEVKKVLESQREKVRKVWADATVPAAYRIGETQAIEERTADQIRALLNDEQKKKYTPPKPQRAAAESSPSVEEWMSKSRPK